MEDDQIDENIRLAQAVNRAYGFEIVSSAKTYEAFENHTNLGHRGFARIKPGLYYRSASDDMIQLVRLQALKGGAYVPYWGVSLGFMPHSWPKIRRHPGVKAARLDVFERALPKKRERKELWDIGSISILHGSVYMTATLRSMWGDYESDIFKWFADVASLEDCLSVAREQSKPGNWRYTTHWPSPMLACAFLLAKLGRIEEAMSELNLYCSRQEDTESRVALEQALLKTR